MAIFGIESLVYGVDDVGESTRFFDDFGLVRDEDAADGGVGYILPEGSRVLILPREHPRLSRSRVVGNGVHEIVWGVADAAALRRVARRLQPDVAIEDDGEGGVRFVTDFGVQMGVRTFERRPVVSGLDALNAPGQANRVNLPRRWRLRARPKVISHVVFAAPDYERSTAFMIERLGFRLSDVQRGFGRYLRGERSSAHHNFLLLNADAPLPDMDGALKFHHANFGVDDVDEIMIGANRMVRQGWQPATWGLGRHRIDSALFYYIPCPAGGEAEYGADGDVVDDGWVPRYWANPLFGFAHYTSNMPAFFMDEPDWNFRYVTDGSTPSDAEQGPQAH